MSKITVAGEALVVKSEVEFEDLKMVEKYRPQNLVLLNEEKEEVFRVATGKTGNIGKYGVTFNKENEGDKKAILTMVIDNGEEDVRSYIADHLGAAIANLNKIEADLDELISEIKAEKQAVMDSIEMM